jgi:hypothetical protein
VRSEKLATTRTRRAFRNTQRGGGECPFPMQQDAAYLWGQTR